MQNHILTMVPDQSRDGAILSAVHVAIIFRAAAHDYIHYQ